MSLSSMLENPRKAAIFFAVTFIGFCTSIALVVVTEKIDSKAKDAEIAALQIFLNRPLVKIEVYPDQLSRKKFEYIFADTSSLQMFQQAAANADKKNISGHSGPVYECVLLLRTAESARKYRASVHLYEPEDLFITSEFHNMRPAARIRLPGLGKWALVNAPAGAL